MSGKKSWLKRADWLDNLSARSQKDQAIFELLHLIDEETQKFARSQEDEKQAGSLAEYLKELLGHIQGYLGCQGIGLFAKDEGWSPVIKLGGRSLGQPDTNWLNDAAKRQCCGYLPDVPAKSWGQISCPIQITLGNLSLDMLVLAGRHVERKDLATVMLLVQFLEKNWRLLDQVLSKANDTAALIQLCRDFTTFLETKSVSGLLQLLAEKSTSLLGCARATIFIHEASSQQLQGSPATGMQEQLFCIPENAGVAGEVFLTGKPINVADANADTRVDHSFDQQTNFATKNILCVPLVNAQKKIIGAFECLNKSTGCFTNQDQFLLELLAHHAAISIQQTQSEEKLLQFQSHLRSEMIAQSELIGTSAAVLAIRSHIKQISQNDLPVLITGEMGTGKKRVAQALHYQGSKAEKPFLILNCAEMTSEHTADHKANIQNEILKAQGGTLVLDEVSLLSIENQTHLLHLLETNQVQVDETSTEKVLNVRLVATSTASLSEKILDGTFLEDLRYRLAVVSIEIPPLRNRQVDIELLVKHFLSQFASQTKRLTIECSTQAIEKLKEYSWVGNVKELKNMMERLTLLCTGEEISMQQVAVLCGMDRGMTSQESLGLTDATLDFQQRFIRQAISKAKGNMTAAARGLGLHRSNLYRKMQQLKMDEAKQEQPEETITG